MREMESIGSVLGHPRGVQGEDHLIHKGFPNPLSSECRSGEPESHRNYF